MDPRSELTFERFTATAGTGEARELARALARGAAGAPRLLLLYGPTGVGKSHLLCAALELAQRRRPGARLVYTSTAQLLQELMVALRADAATRFRLKWEQAETVAVDDLHVLAGKPATQREVGRLFEAILGSGTRVVCAAGCPLGAIRGLVEALRRIPAAHLVELRAAGTPEMRRILAAMARWEGVAMGKDTLAAIAAECGGDVRRGAGRLARHRFEGSRPATAAR